MTALTPWQWVDVLYQGVTPPHGYAEFRLLDPHAPAGTNAMVDRVWLEYPAPAPIAPIWGKKKWMQGHVFMGVALRTEEGQQANEGTRAQTHATHLVWADVDLKHTLYLDGLDPMQASPEELRAAAAACMDDLLASCDEHGLPPRAVVYSGHGLQLYWARRARSTMDDTEAYNRGLAKLLDADPAATDQARILRVPGWQHHKNPDRPLTVELWHTDPDAWVDDAALEPHALRQEVYRRTGDVFVNNGQVSDADLEILQEAWLDVDGHKYDFKGHGRHQLALWTGGWLRTNGYAEADALEVVHQLASTGNDPAIQDRLRAVRDAYRTDNPKGWRGLTEDLGLPLGGIALKEAPRPKIKGAPKVTTQDRPKDGGPTLAEFREMFFDHCAEEGTILAHYEAWDAWFEYQHGVYVLLAEKAVLRMIDNALQERGFLNLSGRKLKDIAQKVAHAPSVARTKIDLGPFQLNVANGILDLVTLELQPHSPDFFSIIQTDIHFDPTAASALWAEFLQGAVPDAEHRKVLQEFAGYALTGDTSAQKALMLTGKGGTGKGTFTHVLTQLLGGDAAYSLAGASPLEAIQDGTAQVEALVGKRVCVISEISKRVDWAPFKRIVGQDIIKVNPKFRDAYTVRLDTKLLILSNVLPRLGEDAGNDSITRRLLLIPFNVKPTSSNPHLRNDLTAPAELSGILNWAIRGLKKLQANRFTFAGVSDAGLERELLEQSNPVILFLEEQAMAYDKGRPTTSALHKAYNAWAEENRYYTTTPKSFSESCRAALDVLGWPYELRKSNGVMTWFGIDLRGGLT